MREVGRGWYKKLPKYTEQQNVIDSSKGGAGGWNENVGAK